VSASVDAQFGQQLVGGVLFIEGFLERVRQFTFADQIRGGAALCHRRGGAVDCFAR